MNPQPKPQPRPKKPHKGLSRSRMKRKRARRIDRKTDLERKYTAWIHEPFGACVGVQAFNGCPRHECEGPIEQSHERHNTGLGLKAKDTRSIRMCRLLHSEWEQHKGPFLGWDNLVRANWFGARVIEANADFELATGVRVLPELDQ